MEVLLRERAQLHLRLKGLEAEVDELRAQKESSRQQAENLQRVQTRQLTESQAALTSVEVTRPVLADGGFRGALSGADVCLSPRRRSVSLCVCSWSGWRVNST